MTVSQKHPLPQSPCVPLLLLCPPPGNHGSRGLCHCSQNVLTAALELCFLPSDDVLVVYMAIRVTLVVPSHYNR
jgi:hypothetical protein